MVRMMMAMVAMMMMVMVMVAVMVMELVMVVMSMIMMVGVMMVMRIPLLLAHVEERFFMKPTPRPVCGVARLLLRWALGALAHFHQSEP